MRILVALVVMVGVARADSECASPSTCRPACDKGDASACAWLGDFYLQGPELDNEVYVATAIRILETACTKGSGFACDRLASAYVRLMHRPETPPARLRELRENACKLGNAESCSDGKQRLALLDKQCTSGRAEACRLLGRAYQLPRKIDDDPPPPPPEDDADESGGTGTAMALDEGKMGKKDARQQAIDQARAAGVLGDEVPGVKPDAKKAHAYSARAEKLVADACAHGRARTCGEGGDDAKSRERACKAGATMRCYELARHAFADGKPWQPYAQRECELGDFIGCLFLASSYEKTDAAKARQYQQKACDAHDPEACGVLGHYEKDPAKAQALYQRACDEGEPYGCEQVGDADPKRAPELYERACALEYWEPALLRPICMELAGKIESKDPAKAKELRKQGCERGEKKACAK
jgi:TPR repeat protein